MEIKNLTCITCPLGCSLTVRQENGQILDISGNTCPRGADYARQEILSPSRTVTTTIEVKNGTERMLPVKTAHEIPKDKIMDCMKCIKIIRVQAPVHIGDIILENAAGTGTAVIASKTVQKADSDL